MNALKASLGCLFIALMFRAGFMLAQGELPWLQLNCHDTAQTHGLQPKHTVIITAFKPTIKQLRDNRWEISFIP